MTPIEKENRMTTVDYDDHGQLSQEIQQLYSEVQHNITLLPIPCSGMLVKLVFPRGQ